MSLPDQPQTSGNPAKALSLEQLGSVEVTTASRKPEKLWTSPTAVFVITHEDIERAGATSIPDALRLAPGVEVARIDSNKWSIGIRGFGSRLSRDVLVLIDGRTVYTTLLAGTYWEVQNIMLEDVDRIEVIRGPGGTIWGPNAVNGVINIITKSAQDTHGDFISTGGGNLDRGFVNARLGRGNGRGLDYRFYGMAFDRGPEYHSDHDNFDEWWNLQAGFRAEYSRNEHNRFTLQGDIYDTGAGERVQAVTYAPPYSQNIDGTARLTGGNILGRWHHVFEADKDFELQAYYDRTNRHEPNFADLRDTFDVDFIDRVPLPWRQHLAWGAGIRTSSGTNPTIISGLFFRPASRVDWLFTGFFSDDVELVRDRLILTLGTKILRTNYTGFQLQPTARIAWTPTKNQTFWAAFTHAVRTPSDAERAFFLSGFIGIATDGLPLFARFNANPHFHSEELNGYEGGFRQLLWQKFSIDIATFYNHYGNLFSEELAGSPFIEDDPPPTHHLLPAEFGNGLVGTTRGIELAPEWRPLPFWQLRASYSFLQMQLQKGTGSLDVGTAPIIEGSSPRHQVTAQSGFNIGKALRLDLTYRYVSALPKQSIESYSTGDVHFSWDVNRSIQLSVVGRSLFQPYHYEFGSDPGALVGIKRSVWGQIAWRR
jgi:iron complex outermembrane receptor protein